MKVLFYSCLFAILLLSCKNEPINHGYLNNLKVNDSLILWAKHDSCGESESISILKKEKHFTGCLYKSFVPCNSRRGKTDIEDCKIFSKTDLKRINNYIDILLKKPTDLSSETYQGLLMYNKGNLTIYTSNDKNWRGFDTLKNETFSFQ